MSTLTICPICRTVCKDHVASTPYWRCPNCAVWFQDPAPPKLWHGAHEPPPADMSDYDKGANEQLAGWLFDDIMHGKPGPTLDIGAAYPYLASRLKARGCEVTCIDGEAAPNDLGVPLTIADFDWDEVAKPETGYQLITLVHSFEHIYRPVDAFHKLRGLLSDDGRLFIRVPDHSVPGIERDLHASMYAIHPFVHTLTSILQLCVESECFEVGQYSRLEPGQADIVLRPTIDIDDPPAITVGMIVKNEERDLPRALSSLDDLDGQLVIVDTGSTDRTVEIAQDSSADVEEYLAASTRDASGDWKLQNFSAARNRAIDLAFGDWYLWMDADDVLITPDAIRRASYWPERDCFTVWIESGGQRWVQHRMWKLDKGVRFKGRCHEYPVIDGLNCAQLDDSLICHHADPTPGESSNARNLRILMAEWEEDGPSARTAFYIANTHRDGSRHKEAAEWYAKRIAFGDAFRDEWLFSYLYGARSLRAAGELDAAMTMLQEAMTLAPDWMEFRMEVANIYYAAKHYAETIAMATPALDASIPPTVLWRERGAYTDQPARLISWCHEHLGDIPSALEWAKKARDRIGESDMDWDARIKRLEQSHGPSVYGAPAVITRKVEPRICIRRPGAIGDVLMTLNLLPTLRRANPGRAIWYFTHPSLAADDALGWIIREAGADQVMSADTFDEWSRTAERAVDLVGYPLKEGYPDKPMQRHLLEYFAAELGLKMRRHTPSLTLQRPKRPEKRENPYATIQTRAGWSKYKQWPESNWNRVIAALPEIYFVRIDESQGMTLRESIALFANARMHLGIDSFCNHLTHYRWSGQQVPGLILWGSTQETAAGYAHNINIARDIPCRPCFREDPAISRTPRGPCINPPRENYADNTPHACMAWITVAEVIAAACALWARTAP